MLSIPWDTANSVVLGVLGTLWLLFTGYLKGVSRRVKRLEGAHVSREEFLQVSKDVETIKRILFLIADKVGVSNEALNR